MRRLLDGLSGDDPKSLRDRAMFELLYSCGLRVSELCGLRRDGVFFDRGLVRVSGKGDKERLVPMGIPAQQALQRYLEAPAGKNARSRARQDLVFPLSRVAVFKILKRRALAAGVTTMTFCVSASVAASSMPLLTSPRIWRGARLATTTICLPTRSSGW